MRDNQIFSDASGKRWLWSRIVAILVVAGVGTLVTVLIPQVEASMPLPGSQNTEVVDSSASLHPTETSILALSSQLRRTNIPVIGSGPLIRVVKINKNTMTTLYTTQSRPIVDQKDQIAVSGADYAIERYGATEGKRISLTFDDGPDPVYSSKVLDKLSEHEMPSTFFLVGKNVAKYPELAQRMVAEGHVVANHSYSHQNFDYISDYTASQEIIQAQRMIRATTGHESAFFRIPYGGDNDQAMRDFLQPILHAQKLGYVVTSYDFDTNDWNRAVNEDIPLPDMSGNKDIVMLLHDGGGDRTNTLKYLDKLAAAAQKAGYTFANLDQIYADKHLFVPITTTIADKAALATTQAIYVWPLDIVMNLFFITVVSIFLTLAVLTTLAVIYTKRSKYSRRKKNYKPLVSILVPAYNESTVIEKAVRSILRSAYRKIEVVIIDDGSSDDTFAIATKLAKRSKRVRTIHQVNGGKAAALNTGIAECSGEVLICVDADTVFPPSTVGRLVRHFVDPHIGAVSGVVKVGNITNMLARWQALEYTVSIHLERAAQAYMNAITVVPGACGAWRKQAVLDAGGYSSSTLAEDCDLTLAVTKAGYRVIQDNSAIGYTEAPADLRTLAKQRFRWIFGNLQSYWKHRSIMCNRRYKLLGTFVLPFATFNTIAPVLFVPVLTALAIGNLLGGQYLLIMLYLLIVLLVQLVYGMIAVHLANERKSLLLAVPLTRFVYSPLKSYLLYKSVLTIFKGSTVGWNKFKRNGSVTLPPQLNHPQPET